MMIRNFNMKLNVELDPYDLDEEKNHPLFSEIEEKTRWKEGDVFTL